MEQAFEVMMITQWMEISKVIISGNGGDMEAGLMIGNKLKSLNVEIIVVDRCISACAIIFMSAERGIILPKGRVLLHGPYVPYIPLNVTLDEYSRYVAKAYLRLSSAFREWGYNESLMFRLADGTNYCNYMEFYSWDDVLANKGENTKSLPRVDLCPVER